jgi:hypothetical protein
LDSAPCKLDMLDSTAQARLGLEAKRARSLYAGGYYDSMARVPQVTQASLRTGTASVRANAATAPCGTKPPGPALKRAAFKSMIESAALYDRMHRCKGPCCVTGGGQETVGCVHAGENGEPRVTYLFQGTIFFQGQRGAISFRAVALATGRLPRDDSRHRGPEGLLKERVLHGSAIGGLRGVARVRASPAYTCSKGAPRTVGPR